MGGGGAQDLGGSRPVPATRAYLQGLLGQNLDPRDRLAGEKSVTGGGGWTSLYQQTRNPKRSAPGPVHFWESKLVHSKQGPLCRETRGPVASVHLGSGLGALRARVSSVVSGCLVSGCPASHGAHPEGEDEPLGHHSDSNRDHCPLGVGQRVLESPWSGNSPQSVLGFLEHDGGPVTLPRPLASSLGA